MKKIIIILLITFGVAVLPTIFIDFNTDYLIKPALFPPKILFPIVWTVLYILMSISLYLASKNDSDVYKVYGIQLVLNSLWSPLFFLFKTYLFSTLELVILILFVVVMVFQMYYKSNAAGYLQIPYFIWLLFALYLNVSIFILN